MLGRSSCSIYHGIYFVKMFHSLDGANSYVEFVWVLFNFTGNFNVLSSRATFVSEDLLLESVPSNYHAE